MSNSDKRTTAPQRPDSVGPSTGFLLQLHVITLKVSDEPDSAYLDLAWDIFFRQRGRGLHLGIHFPWATTPRNHIWYVLARHGDAVIGGLTVLERRCAKGMFGIVGLVCVDPSMRGQKTASRLMQHAIEHAHARGCGALTLWTGQPYVYTGQGFVVHDGGAYGWVTRAARMPSTSDDVVRTIRSTEIPGSDRGIPPFALGMKQIECTATRATVTLVEDAKGPIVAEWHGEDSDVEALLCVALPERFRLNCRQDDSLVAAMLTSGWTASLQPTQLQMWRVSDAASTPRDWDDASRLRLLDRI